MYIFTHFITHHLSQEFPYVMRTSLILNNIKHMLCKLPLIIVHIVDTQNVEWHLLVKYKVRQKKK